MNSVHRANARNWDRMSDWWSAQRAADGLLPQLRRRPALAFDGAALGFIERYLAHGHGARACVIGSGDNYASIALAHLGMTVTSVDISQRQLEHAAERAAQAGVSITFVCADAAEMNAVTTAGFQLVVSTNGFFVWIDDLQGVFDQVARILTPGGIYVGYDVHPFQRPWADGGSTLRVEKPYWDRQARDADADSFEHHWTLADLLNPMARAGLQLLELNEAPASSSRFWEDGSYLPGTNRRLLDWTHNPRAAMPVWLTIAARRP